MYVQASPAKYKYNLDGENETSRQLATSGGREIVSVIITAGGGAAAVRIVDTANGAGGYPSKDSFLLAANTGESTVYAPGRPVPFTRGLYLILEQGAAFGAEVFITYN